MSLSSLRDLHSTCNHLLGFSFTISLKVKFMHSSNHIYPRGGVIFRTLSDWPTQPPPQWVPGIFPGGGGGCKAAGTWCWPPTQSSAEFKEGANLYLCSPSGPSWSVPGWTFALFLTNYIATEKTTLSRTKYNCISAQRIFDKTISVIGHKRRRVGLLQRQLLPRSTANSTVTTCNFRHLKSTSYGYRPEVEKCWENASELEGRRTKILQGYVDRRHSCHPTPHAYLLPRETCWTKTLNTTNATPVPSVETALSRYIHFTSSLQFY